MKMKMKMKILGLLAVGLLAGPTSANAAYLYTVSIGAQELGGFTFAADSFSFVAPTLLDTFSASASVTATGDLNGFAPQQANVCGQTMSSGVIARQSLCSLTIPYLPFTPGTVIGFTLVLEPRIVLGVNNVISAGRAVTTSDASFVSISTGASGTLTISEVSVPEPGTLALLGFGLAGIGLSRRRKAN